MENMENISIPVLILRKHLALNAAQLVLIRKNVLKEKSNPLVLNVVDEKATIEKNALNIRSVLSVDNRVLIVKNVLGIKSRKNVLYAEQQMENIRKNASSINLSFAMNVKVRMATTRKHVLIILTEPVLNVDLLECTRKRVLNTNDNHVQNAVLRVITRKHVRNTIRRLVLNVDLPVLIRKNVPDMYHAPAYVMNAGASTDSMSRHVPNMLIEPVPNAVLSDCIRKRVLSIN